jgi:two-component system nitrogen regulation response regulator GlnG
MADAPLILVVDDDAAVCWTVERLLAGAGWRTAAAADAAAARRQIRRQRPDLVLTDVRMPGESGLDLLAGLRAQHPDLPVLVTTAHGDVATAVEAVRRGAAGHLPKPLAAEELLAAVRRALGERPLAAAARPQGAAAPELVGSGPAMQEVYRRIAAAAASDLDVLIAGPVGSGRSLAARMVHRFTAGAGACVAVAAATHGDALPRELPIRAAAAAGGTLVLDGAADLPPAVQAWLAAWLADRRDGDGRPLSLRVVALFPGDPARLRAEGRLRDDLLWRLQAFTIRMPPLTERGEDLPALVRALLGRTSARTGRALALTDAAMDRLARHDWPGQVRELEQVLEEAAALARDGTIDREHLRLAGDGGLPEGSLPRLLALAAERLADGHPGAVHARYTDLVEAPLFAALLARTRGNQLRAAELLGINRGTLRKRMLQLGLLREEDGADGDG